MAPSGALSRPAEVDHPTARASSRAAAFGAIPRRSRAPSTSAPLSPPSPRRLLAVTGFFADETDAHLRLLARSPYLAGSPELRVMEPSPELQEELAEIFKKEA